MYQAEYLRKYKLDILVIAALSLLVLGVFYKTVFLGVSISRSSMLADIDSLFSAQATGVKQPYDPMICQLHIPYYLMISKQLQAGHLELWNQLSGTGCPLIGDIQSLVLAPLPFALSPWASLHTYNLMLILYLVICISSSYLLSRALAIGRSASIFAALVYTFCPFVLRWLEPPGGPAACLYPTVCWLFVRVAHKASLQRCAIAAIACAALILSGHIQYTLWEIIFSSALAIVVVLTNKEHSSVKPIAAIGFSLLIAFLLSAPVLLPFAEYLKNSDCYKTVIPQGHYHTSWQAIVFCLLHPGFGSGSSYLGCITFMMLPLAAFVEAHKKQLVASISLLDLLAVIVVCCPGPLAFLFDHPPLSWLQTRYCIPTIMLFTALVAASGFEEFTFKLHWGTNRKTWALILSAAAIIGIPLAIRFTKLDTSNIYLDPFLPAMLVNYAAVIRDFVLISMLFALSITAARSKIINPRFAAAFLIGLSFISEFSTAKAALPAQAYFSYPAVDPLPFLKARDKRVLSFGAHSFVSDSNFVFGIQNFCATNVLWPSRFLSFVSAAGGSLRGVDQRYDKPLTKLIDLAGIKYVVSQVPVLSEDDPNPIPVSINDNPTTGSSEVQLTNASCLYDPINRDAFGKLTWALNYTAPQHFHYRIAVTNYNNKVLWYGDESWFSYGIADNSSPTPRLICTNDLFAIIPKYADVSKGFKVEVELIDLRSTSNSKLITIYDSLLQHNYPSTRHFRCISERRRDCIRVYENLHVLPQVYIVHKVCNAQFPQQVLKIIKSPDFDPRRTVVTEQAVTKPTVESGPGTETITWQRTDSDHVDITVSLKTNGFVVLTDTYYPGWSAYIDGSPTEILRANYLFRALYVPAGHHHINFNYEPLSFRLGIWLMLAGAALVFYAVLRTLQE